MFNIVLDTNVLISAALTPKGTTARLIDFITNDKEIQLYYSSDIMEEYQEVISREYLKISYEIQQNILRSIGMLGIQIMPIPSTIPLPDESDRTFYDTAKACNAFLITGNLKHYPTESHIMSPADFLRKTNGGN